MAEGIKVIMFFNVFISTIVLIVVDVRRKQQEISWVVDTAKHDNNFSLKLLHQNL